MENKNNKRKEKIDEDSIPKLIKTAQEQWFLLGYLKGFYTSDKKLKKSLINIEKEMEKTTPDVWIDYQNAWKYTENALHNIISKKPYKIVVVKPKNSSK